MMFLMMVRVDDPLVPRAMFGVLNVLLLYPSGAMYPIVAFPKWLQAIARHRSLHLCVHGFKAVLLKNGGWVAIRDDLLFLSFSALARYWWQRRCSSGRCKGREQGNEKEGAVLSTVGDSVYP